MLFNPVNNLQGTSYRWRYSNKKSKQDIPFHDTSSLKLEDCTDVATCTSTSIGYQHKTLTIRVVSDTLHTYVFPSNSGKKTRACTVNDSPHLAWGTSKRLNLKSVCNLAVGHSIRFPGRFFVYLIITNCDWEKYTINTPWSNKYPHETIPFGTLLV